MRGITTRPVVIVGGTRIPFCRMGTSYNEVPLLDLLTESLKGLVDRFGLKGEKVDDVALGTVFYPPALWNLAREAVLKSGLSPESGGLGVQRACATSLDAAIVLADKIALGKMEVGIAGGAESMSNISLYFHPNFSRRMVSLSKAKSLGDRLKVLKGFSLNELKPKAPAAFEPTTGKSMGEHCEVMAKDWKISRQDQDVLALASHQNGVRAFKEKFYDDLVLPFKGVAQDNCLRGDTTIEKMAKLKPSFDPTEGTLTAGNSSPLTDGAACVLLASEEWVKKRRLVPLAYLVDYETCSVDIKREGLLMAPTYAVPKILQRQKLSLQSFDFYEIHEAFAAQVLCTLKAWETEAYCKDRLKLEGALGSIAREKLNTVGGSVALGHPFGATGARLLATLAKLLSKKGSGKGLVSICTGGGMGTAAVLER